MEHLYVCEFSNGFIKVGRSNRPGQRIAQHKDRVACLGVEMVRYYIVQCRDEEEREQSLINKCVTAATARHQYEWFDGLDFDEVCVWAASCATCDLFPQDTRWTDVIRQIRKAGWKQADIAEAIGVTTSAMSRLALGQTPEPLHSVGEKLLALQVSVLEQRKVA